jgi:Domain of unknown function (DUF1772)
MRVLSDVFAAVAVLALAAIYGAEVFAMVVLRSALTHVDEPTLSTMMGRIHQYGDRRLPVFFIVGLLGTVLSGVTAALAGGRPIAAIGVAVLSLLAWLWVFLRISAPINRRLTAAADAGRNLPDARDLQRRWDRVIPIRLTLQTLALAGLCVELAVP